MKTRAGPHATPAAGRTLLDPANHVLMMIDYQPQTVFATASIDRIALRNNVSLVANATNVFAVPAVLTTLSADSFGGSLLDEVRSALPEVPVFDRTTMNCWEDSSIVSEINRLGKNRIVMSGLWSGVCVASAALSALDQDFDVYIITDASGDVSEEAHERAIERMVQVGARPMTALQYLLELQRDWARTETAAKTTSVILSYGGAYGLGMVYAAKILSAAESN